MPLPINPIIDAGLGAAVESAHVIISEGNPTFLAHVYTDSTLQDLQFYINGTPYAPGTTPTVSQGDEIWITGTAPATYFTPVFANILLESAAFMSIAVVTIQDPALKVLDPAYIDKPMSEYFGAYVPSDPQNRLVKVDTSNDSATITNILNVATPDAGTFSDGLPYVFATDYVNNKVHRINPNTGIVVHSIDINKPHGLGYTPVESYIDNTIANTLISSPADNTVYVYNGDTHAQIGSAVTGAGPHGVCGELSEVAGDYGFWVACFDADRVEHWQYTNGVSLVRDYFYSLDVGSGPYDVKVDANGDAIVSCLISDKVAKCPKGGAGTVTYVTVGTDPWEIYLRNGFAYVACAGTSDVYAVDIGAMTAAVMNTIQNVTHVEVANDKLYVGSFNTGEFASYVLSSDNVTLGASVDIAESQRLFEGMIGSDDGASLFAVNMHNDLPERTALPDNSPDNLTFVSQTGLSINTLTNSNVVTISGVDSVSTLTVPSTTNSPISPYMEKNDVDSGQSTTTADGDSIELLVTTPNDATGIPKIFIPLVYDGGVQIWTLTLVPGAKARISGWLRGG